jgi:hypothetical protein
MPSTPQQMHLPRPVLLGQRLSLERPRVIPRNQARPLAECPRGGGGGVYPAVGSRLWIAQRDLAPQDRGPTTTPDFRI